MKERVSQCKKCKSETYRAEPPEIDICSCGDSGFTVVIPWGKKQEYKESITDYKKEKKVGIDINRITQTTILRCSNCGKERPAKNFKKLRCVNCGKVPTFIRFKKVK